MKKIFLISILYIAFINCSDNTNNSSPSFDVSPIIGKWQYAEELDYNPPGPYLITNGPTIDLNSEGTFISTEITNYPNGTYTISADSIITLKYISNSDNYIKQKKIIFYSADEMILDNDYLGSGACVEGCAERYSRINQMQLRLNGSWENTGYYDDVVNPENPELENYYPIPNGVTITYSSTTYSSTYLNNPHENGSFSVSNDSILKHNNIVIGKITLLNETELIVVHPTELGGARYTKI